MRIAFVDDDHEMLGISKEAFGHLAVIYTYDNPITLINEARYRNFDVIITDFRMPIVNGGELINTLRSSGYLGHMLIHTSAYGVDMLAFNPDDIIVKDFSAGSLDRLVFSVNKIKTNNMCTWSGITFDSLNSNIIIMGNKINLTAGEFKILKLVMLNDGKIVSKDNIRTELFNNECTDSAICTAISSLRKKMGEYSVLIETKKNHGLFLNSSIWDEVVIPDSVVKNGIATGRINPF